MNDCRFLFCVCVPLLLWSCDLARFFVGHTAALCLQQLEMPAAILPTFRTHTNQSTAHTHTEDNLEIQQFAWKKRYGKTALSTGEILSKTNRDIKKSNDVAFIVIRRQSRRRRDSRQRNYLFLFFFSCNNSCGSNEKSINMLTDILLTKKENKNGGG